MASKAFLQLANKASFTVNTFIRNPLLAREEQLHAYNLEKAVNFVILRLQRRKVKGYTKQYIRQLLQKEYKHFKRIKALAKAQGDEK